MENIYLKPKFHTIPLLIDIHPKINLTIRHHQAFEPKRKQLCPMIQIEF